MAWKVRSTFGVIVCSIAVACSSPPANPTAPAAVPQNGVIGAHTACHEDVLAPTITNLNASPNRLWPPNHKWWTVQVNYIASDACGIASCSLSVTSNEPVNGIGDGNTSPDWQVVDADTVRLRAERAGPGNGRIYTITVTCRDVAGNSATANTQVRVVHDQGK